MNKLKILIADDHALVRMGLKTLLETEPDLEVVGEAEDGAEAVRLSLRLKPDVVIMDIMMPGIDGIEATRRLIDAQPDARVLILTTSTVSTDINRALEVGAIGVLSKSTGNALMPKAIRTVAVGTRYLAPEVAELLESDPPPPKLTERQTEILLSITRGLSNADIAKQLGIRPEGVKSHLNAIFRKLGVANRAEAVSLALRKHLLKI